MNWMKYPENSPTIKLGSQPTGQSIFKYDKMAKEKLLWMGIRHLNSSSSFHLAIITSPNQ